MHVNTIVRKDKSVAIKEFALSLAPGAALLVVMMFLHQPLLNYPGDYWLQLVVYVAAVVFMQVASRQAFGRFTGPSQVLILMALVTLVAQYGFFLASGLNMEGSIWSTADSLVSKLIMTVFTGAYVVLLASITVWVVSRAQQRQGKLDPNASAPNQEIE